LEPSRLLSFIPDATLGGWERRNEDMDDSKQALTELLKEAVTAVQGAIEVG